MPEQNTEGLSLEELQKLDGFEDLDPQQLDQALRFIDLITELLIETI